MFQSQNRWKIALLAVVWGLVSSVLACGQNGLPPGVLPAKSPTPELATITWDDVELVGDQDETLFAGIQYIMTIDVVQINSNSNGTEARAVIVGPAQREIIIFAYDDYNITVGNRYRVRTMLYRNIGTTTFQVVEYELIGETPDQGGENETSA